MRYQKDEHRKETVERVQSQRERKTVAKDNKSMNLNKCTEIKIKSRNISYSRLGGKAGRKKQAQYVAIQ